MRKPATAYRAVLVTSVFLLFICLPCINRFHFFKDIQNTEWRVPAVKPEINIGTLDMFPAKYEAWFQDHFILRNIWLKTYNRLHLQYFHLSPIPSRAMIGKQGWLYYTGKENMIYKGSSPLTPDELEQLADELEYRSRYLAERHCKFYVMIAPVKACIYPQYLPDTLRMLAGKPWGVQLEEYLAGRGVVKTIPLHVHLRQHNDMPLYFKLDNHWNENGALLSVNEAIRIMQQDFPLLRPMPSDSFYCRKETTHSGNIIRMLSYGMDATDTNFILTPWSGFHTVPAPRRGYPKPPDFAEAYELEWEIPGSSAPRLMLISDSFGFSSFRFFAEHFSRSVKLFDAWKYQLHPDIVEQEKPDIMVLLILETNLRSILEFKEPHL